MFLCSYVLKSAEGVFVAAAGFGAAAIFAAAVARFSGRSAACALHRRVVGQPLDARRHQAAGGYGAFGLSTLAGGDELDAYGLHLLLEVEVVFVGDALGLQRVAEGAQAVQADRLALRHVVRHHARQLAQDGHHVGVGDGAHLAQPLGHFLHRDGLTHDDSTGVVDAKLFVEYFLVETHSVCVVLRVSSYWLMFRGVLALTEQR